MKKSAFPDCCAGRILHDFGGTALTSGFKGDYTLDEIVQWIKQQERICAGAVGFFILAVNPIQNVFMAPILQELNYKCVSENIRSPGHPSSGVLLYLKQF